MADESIKPIAGSGRSTVREETSATRLELAVLVHLGLLLVGLAWAFGGQVTWARLGLSIWGTVGALLFLAGCVTHHRGARTGFLTALRDLWPLLLFDGLVAASCFNPSFRQLLRGGEAYFMVVDPPYAWLPGSARPDLAWRALLRLNAIVLSCYNVRLVLQSRRHVRALLFVAAANAVALAIFGTFQKLAGASGLWFGLVHSPQPYFFATFIYHNHWGAFMLLNVAVGFGLLYHSLRRGEHRDVWHSPALAGAVAVLLLAATVPLSASRSSSLLVSLFVLGALVHFLARLIGRRRAAGESIALPVAAIAAAALVAAAAVFYLGRGVITQRARLTAVQVERIRREDTLNSRLTLYRDTWRMALDKPWCGWGLESYGDVFRIYNSQRAVEVIFGQPYYRDAHSDWLQSLAETGFVGTGLLILLGVLPVLRVPWRRVGSVLPRYLLAGCGVVLLYAWIEFPLACPSVLLGFWFNLYAAVRYAALDPGVSAS